MKTQSPLTAAKIRLRKAAYLGAAMLDNQDFGSKPWFMRVRIRLLDMQEMHLCVLGQLMNGDIENWERIVSADEWSQYGFDLGIDEELEDHFGPAEQVCLYQFLTNVWKDLIRKRRAA